MKGYTVSRADVSPNSRDETLVAGYDLRQRMTGISADLSGKGKDGAIVGKPMAGQSLLGRFLQFDGTNNYINSGNVGSIKSIAFWMNPDSTTEDIVDLDGGTHTIEITAGTLSATGFSSPSLYVNGALGSSVVADAPQFIGVSTATGISATALLWGLLAGKIIGEFVASSEEKDANWFAEQYALGQRALWKSNPVDITGNVTSGWIGRSPFVSKSSFKIVNDTIGDDDVKSIECVSAGNLQFPQAIPGEVAEDDNWRGWVDIGSGYVEGALSPSSRLLAFSVGDKICLGSLIGKYSVIKSLL